jgi:hypothetical protein
VLAIMVAMFIIHEQTVTEKSGNFVTVTRFRYPESTRFQIRVALLGLPAAAAMVMIWVLGTTQQRLRSTVPDYLKEGRRLLVQGAADAALAQFNKAVEISPYLGEAYLQRGFAYLARGQSDEALDDFDRAVSADPQLSIGYLQRGKIRSDKGDMDEALEDFDRVLTMRPNDPESYLYRGVCLARKGAITDAINDFHRVLKLTNHTDYADPARYYLQQLGAIDPAQMIPPPAVNGTRAPAELTPPQSSQVNA